MWIPRAGYPLSPADFMRAQAGHGCRPRTPPSAAAAGLDRSGRALAGSSVQVH